MPDSPPRLTLADIAQLAGVGLGTASRALRDTPGVAPATRARVRAIADQHEYVVSPDASRLAGGATGRIAVLVPHLSRWFFGTMLEAVDDVLRAADFDVLLYHVGGLQDRRAFFTHLPARRKVDAVVVVAFPVEDNDFQRLERLGVHVVAAGGQHAVYPYVCIDDKAAGRLAMNHLVALGHRRIAMIADLDVEQPRAPSGRSAAYSDALAAHGLPADASLVVTAPWGGEEGAEAMARLLSLPELPTAVYAHSDEVAIGAMRTIRHAGLRVPEDISVIGIDDHPMASLADLTTVRQPVYEQGRRAAQLLLGLLRGDAVTHDNVLETRLIVRRSCAPPRGDAADGETSAGAARPARGRKVQRAG